MPEPSNPEARRAQDEIRGLLEIAATQQAESSASRQRGLASEQPAEPSRQERDLDIAFKCLRAKNIKLNPEKCVFGVPRGMLLGFIISERGIEANLEKITAITKMGPIRDLKGVQRVTAA
jgi:hypothetical protein